MVERQGEALSFVEDPAGDGSRGQLGHSQKESGVCVGPVYGIPDSDGVDHRQAAQEAPVDVQNNRRIRGGGRFGCVLSGAELGGGGRVGCCG